MQTLKPQNLQHKWQELTKTQRQLTIINTKEKSLMDKSNYSQSEASEKAWNNKRYELVQGFSNFWCYGAHEEIDHSLRSPTINLF